MEADATDVSSIFAKLTKEFEKISTKLEEVSTKLEEVSAIVIPEKKVRLVQSLPHMNEKQGRLEVWHAGQWGTVCDDEFDDTDAAVVCRTLGWTGGSKWFSNAGYYGWLSKDPNHDAQESELGALGNGPIWLNRMRCAGTENNFLDCPRGITFYHTGCSHWEDVFMKCT